MVVDRVSGRIGFVDLEAVGDSITGRSPSVSSFRVCGFCQIMFG